MRTREDFDAALPLVASVVRSWDPCDLLALGAPPDEFDGEIARVVSCIPRISNAAAAAEVLSSVFSASFEPELFSSAQCAVPGEELFASLSAAGLVALA